MFDRIDAKIKILKIHPHYFIKFFVTRTKYLDVKSSVVTDFEPVRLSEQTVLYMTEGFFYQNPDWLFIFNFFKFFKIESEMA